MLTNVNLNELEWNDYISEHGVPYRETYLDNLLKPYLKPHIRIDVSVTLRRYPVRYFLAWEEFGGQEYTLGGDGDGLVPATICAYMFGKYMHAYFETQAPAILNELIYRLNENPEDDPRDIPF